MPCDHHFNNSAMDNCTDLWENLTIFNCSDFGGSFSTENDLPWWVGFVEICYLSIITILGIPENSLILFSHKITRDKTSTDYLIAGMAMYELFCSSVNSLTKIIQNTNLWQMFASDTVCRVHFVFMYVTAFASPFFLAAIALDRYFKTCHPLRNVFTIRRSKVICVILSVASFITAWPIPITYELNKKWECSTAKEYIALQISWDMALIALTVIIFAVYIFSYVNIAITLRQRVKLRKTLRSQGDVASTEESSVSRFLKRFSKFRVVPLNQLQQVRLEIKTNTGEELIGIENGLNESDEAGTSQCNRDSSGQEKRTDDTQLAKSREEKYSKMPSVRVPQKQLQIERTVNRTTLIMFLLTVIYAVTYIPVNIYVVTASEVLGLEMEKLCKSILSLNCISNPILFFCMSSKYRSAAKTAFSKFKCH